LARQAQSDAHTGCNCDGGKRAMLGLIGEATQEKSTAFGLA
jgi:hypothetical protein